MTLIKNILAACIMAALFASCDADPKGKIISESFSTMEEIIAVLKTVRDKGTAETAKPKLEVLVAKVFELKERAGNLNISEADMQKEMEKNEEKLDKLIAEMMSTLMEISKDPEIKSILSDTIKKLN